jgi:branched-chain amino acid transport system ATP-binding protein
MTAAPLLEANDIRRTFGGFVAVDGVSLAIREGEVAALIGSNGAGKTTFYNIISGRLTPSAGTVRFRGRNITGLPPHRIARLGIGRSFQITNIFAELTVTENVSLALVARGGQSLVLWRRVAADAALRRRAVAVLERLGIGALADQRAGTLSYGDKRLVELAIVLAGEPTLVLLDEPTAGMTPEETHVVVRLIRDLAEAGPYTFFITEHDMEVVFGLAERVFVMHRGQLLAQGTPEEIRMNPDVRAAYLGEDAA